MPLGAGRTQHGHGLFSLGIENVHHLVAPVSLLTDILDDAKIWRLLLEYGRFPNFLQTKQIVYILPRVILELPLFIIVQG